MVNNYVVLKYQFTSLQDHVKGIGQCWKVKDDNIKIGIYKKVTINVFEKI